MSSAKLCPFYLGLNVLMVHVKPTPPDDHTMVSIFSYKNYNHHDGLSPLEKHDVYL